jgi:hypothetical protein
MPSSLNATAEHWEDDFVLLRDAGLPTFLDGRTLRLPGADREHVTAAIAPLAGSIAITLGVATLKETMMLAARGSSEGSMCLRESLMVLPPLLHNPAGAGARSGSVQREGLTHAPLESGGFDGSSPIRWSDARADWVRCVSRVSVWNLDS